MKHEWQCARTSLPIPNEPVYVLIYTDVELRREALGLKKCKLNYGESKLEYIGDIEDVCVRVAFFSDTTKEWVVPLINIDKSFQAILEWKYFDEEETDY